MSVNAIKESTLVTMIVDRQTIQMEISVWGGVRAVMRYAHEIMEIASNIYFLKCKNDRQHTGPYLDQHFKIIKRCSVVNKIIWHIPHLCSVVTNRVLSISYDVRMWLLQRLCLSSMMQKIHLSFSIQARSISSLSLFVSDVVYTLYIHKYIQKSKPKRQRNCPLLQYA